MSMWRNVLKNQTRKDLEEHLAAAVAILVVLALLAFL